MRTATQATLVLALTTLAACAVEDAPSRERAPEADEETRRPREGEADQVDATGTCEDVCGGQSELGCWCDDLCEEYGDCCEDKLEWCEAPEPEPEPEPEPQNTCDGHCGNKAPGGCWCDEECEQYGDCCEDKADACTAVADDSCAGRCGDKAPDGCWCDEQCEEYGDCCEDVVEECAPVQGVEGADCTGAGSCEPGLVCEGIPQGGSIGKCIDPSPVPGTEDPCNAPDDCGAGLICVGLVAFGEGSCAPAWMGGTFAQDPGLAIADVGSASSEVLVYGLATVPVDIQVELDIDHPAPAQLEVRLHDPNGVTATVWNNEAAPASTINVVGIPGDDMVNGTWRLEVIDSAAGSSGVLQGWKLNLTSRFD